MMKKLSLLLMASLAGQSVLEQEKVGGKVPKAERHEFVIANFKTESGVTLPQARVVYGTYGKLNDARDNTVLLPSHYMADFRSEEHTSELQSHSDLVCRLLLEKKKTKEDLNHISQKT